jgi:hypothetical protein
MVKVISLLVVQSEKKRGVAPMKVLFSPNSLTKAPLEAKSPRRRRVIEASAEASALTPVKVYVLG